MRTKMADPFVLMYVLRYLLTNTKRCGYEAGNINLNTQDNLEFIVSFPNGEERTAVLKLVAE